MENKFDLFHTYFTHMVHFTEFLRISCIRKCTLDNIQIELYISGVLCRVVAY